MIKRYKPLVIFFGIGFVGIVAKMFDIGKVWNIYEYIDTASAVALAVLAFLGYLEFIQSEDNIKLFFQVGEKKIDTNLSVLRKNCTRSEVLGILGMIQSDLKSRYELRYAKNIDMLNKLQEIQKGNLDEFIIPITDVELKQFDIIKE